MNYRDFIDNRPTLAWLKENTPMRCVMSHNGYGCKAGADHEGDTHKGADGHEWETTQSVNYDPDPCACDKWACWVCGGEDPDAK